MSPRIGKRRVSLIAFPQVILFMAGCTGVETDSDLISPVIGITGISEPSADQKRRAEQITSVFENDTIALQYAYIEALNDGRGYTAGRAGFTTGTGDLLEVVERYSQARTGSELARYLPRLRELAAERSGAITGLAGLPAAWTSAADDVEFRMVQDQVVDQDYYNPALIAWHSAGLRSALALACFYDAIIQHGGGDDHDGLPAMIERTTKNMGGVPATGIAEGPWLAAFLDVRQATLAHAADPATRAAWADSQDRVEAERALLMLGNFDLHGPIEINTKYHQAKIP